MKILKRITAVLTIAAFTQFSFAPVVQNIPVPASSTGGASTASVVVPSLAQITTLATNLSNTAYTNATSYTDAAIVGITCPTGQVRQGTSCVVPINANDVATAANAAYTNATNYTNTAIANITCPSGQVRQGNTCVVPISATDVSNAANAAYTNAVNTSNTYAANYTNTAISNITCPAGQVRQGTSCVVPINATDVASAANSAYSSAVSVSNINATNYTNTAIANITCPAGQVRPGTTCIVPINATDVSTAAENARASAVLTSMPPAWPTRRTPMR